MSTPGQENKAPSVAELQKFVREKTKMEFHLSNGDRIAGTLRWFDEHCFSVIETDAGVVTVMRHAVMTYRAGL
jgi:sRNA-binding regulator protein Hfq